ncbi:unnamed protein product [Rotaria sordida]|uniref:Kinesin light chain n=2 Tax=Rotaria sordida TaxID=392033 RepID=A0A819GR46_9BILA|nr:unnamed protein product [Rotaria sordida]
MFMGFAYRNQYDTDHALESLEQALWMKKKYASDDVQSIATILEGLAIIYGDKGNYHNALQHALECLIIREKCLPQNHIDIGTNFNLIADCYANIENRNMAVEYHRRALAVFKQIQSIEDPLIDISEKNIHHHRKHIHAWFLHGRKCMHRLKKRLFSS